mgnify:CR=1 FL=1
MSKLSKKFLTLIFLARKKKSKKVKFSIRNCVKNTKNIVLRMLVLKYTTKFVLKNISVKNISVKIQNNCLKKLVLKIQEICVKNISVKNLK